MKLASVCLTGLGIATLAPAASADLVISEVLYNEAGSDSFGEFVEIYNNGSTTIDLTNYKIGDEETSGSSSATEAMFLFPNAATIAPGEVQIIAVSGAVFFAQYGFSANYEVAPDPISNDPAAVDLAIYSAWDPDGGRINMSNSNDQLVIFDGSDNVVDAVNWGNTVFLNPGLDASAEGDGQSWSRINANIDTDTADDWVLTDAAPSGAVWANQASPGTVSIPEPGSLALLGLGGLALLRRRK